jgi:ribonuclease T1
MLLHLMRFPRWLLVALLLLAGPASADESRLRAFAEGLGLVDVEGFAEAVESIDRTGRLPRRYLTKDEAASLGWKPGSNLCRVAPGRSIGGDRFGNREKRLPEAPERRWREADLDYFCGKRGAKRLVWSSDGLKYVTTDHYESFREVPR